jgi:predicted Fe-Mo cluster-binding NifX family protein
MRFAISTDTGQVSAHFGRCPHFTIGDIENGVVTQKEVITNPGHHPGFLPQFLSERGVNCIIAGGMGGRAIALFTEKNITPMLGISGSVDEVIEKLRQGILEHGDSLCSPGGGKGYGIDKTECTHDDPSFDHDHDH